MQPRTQNRSYTFSKRLVEDGQRPNIILMPLLSPGSSSRDLSYLLAQPYPDKSCEDTSAQTDNPLHISEDAPSLVKDGPEATDNSLFNNPPHHRGLIRSNARHYWYSSHGPTSISAPPAPPPGIGFKQDIVFVHWNHTKSTYQFWWRDAGNEAKDWTILKFGDKRRFDGEEFHFSWSPSGEPSWIRPSTFGKKEKKSKSRGGGHLTKV